MANVYAVKTGNWSDVTVWNTGALPTSADDVYSNNFTVTIDQNVTVLTIRNTSATGITQGGTYIVTGNFTITATNLIKFDNSSNTLITYNGTGTVNFNVNMTNSGVGGTLLDITGNGNVNFVGSITGWNGDGPRRAITKSGIGKLTFTGDISANYFLNNYVVDIASGDFEMTGNATVTSTLSGVSGFAGSLIRYSGTGNFTITGNITNDAQRTNGSQITNVIQTSSACLIRHIGTMSNLNALGGFCLSSSNISAINILSGPFICSTYGLLPFFVYRMNLITTSNSYFEFRDSSTNGALPPSAPAPATRLVSPSTVIDAPAESDVRFGVVYASGSQTGTLRVPLPGQVALGVPTDNTTGSAILTAAAIWNTQLSTMTTSGSIGERLSNVATVQTTAAQIAAF